MRTYDFSPLFRSTIGFDIDLAETAQRVTDEGYPPYDVERLAEDRYQITLAVAGFSADEISITASRTSSPSKAARPRKPSANSCIAASRHATSNGQFNLADYVQVKNASFDNGLLKIELVREISRGHEAAADRHQRRGAGQRAPAQEVQGGPSERV